MMGILNIVQVYLIYASIYVFFSDARSILRAGHIGGIDIFYNRSKLFYFQGSTPRM